MNRLCPVFALLSVALAWWPVPAGAEVPPDVAKAAEQVLGYMEAIAQAGTAASGDCEAMSRALQTLAETREAEVKAAFAVLDQLPALVEDELEKRYKPRMDAVENDIAVIFPCATHPGVEAAMNAFFDAGPELPPVEPPRDPISIEQVQLTDAMKDKAERLVSFMEEMGEIADGKRADCDAMGKALEALIAAKGAAMKAAAAELDALDDATDEALKELFDARMSKAESRLEGLGACFDHPGVQAAMQSLF